ncbi:hypothetical protein BH10PLA2_BH10PLA2_00260 [soil metagenome]
MADFYEAYRALYGILFGEKDNLFAARIDLEGKVPALRETLSEMKIVRDGLQSAYGQLSEAGSDTTRVSREIRRAVFVCQALGDLLIEFADGSVAITAARAAIDSVNASLDKLDKSAQSLATDLGNASLVINAVARLLKMID